MQPPNFDIEFSDDWSRWVLAHGLPELPGPDLGLDESVPVAFWVGPTTAAVLHIRRLSDADDTQPDDFAEVDVALYALQDRRWESCGGGGAGPVAEPALGRPEVSEDHVDLSGVNCGGGGAIGCKALWGEVGRNAVSAEVEQAGKITRRAIESPTGLIVVSAEPTKALTVRVFGANDTILAEVEEPAGFDFGD